MPIERISRRHARAACAWRAARGLTKLSATGRPRPRPGAGAARRHPGAGRGGHDDSPAMHATASCTPSSFPSGSRRGVLGALLLPVPEIPVPNSTSRSVRSSGVVKSSLSPAGLCSKRKRQRGHSSAYFRRAISSHSVPEVFNYEPCHCIFFANIFSNDTCRLAV